MDQTHLSSIPESKVGFSLIEDLLRKLMSCDMNFCVLRNSESIINSFPTGDVDILLKREKSAFAKVIKILKDSQAKLGFQIYNITWHANVSINVYIATKIDGLIRTINLEFFHEVFVYEERKFISKKYAYFKIDDILRTKKKTRGYYVCAKEYEILNKIIEILFNYKDKYINSVVKELDVCLINNNFQQTLFDVMGEVAKVDFVENYTQMQDFGWRLKLRDKVQKHFEEHKVFPFLDGVIRNFASGYRHLVQYLSPPGMFCSALGTDGSGKSTICDSFKDKHNRAFALVNRIHLGNRPILLPSLRGHRLDSVNNQLDAGANLNYHTYKIGASEVSLYQCARFIYITFDYILHYFTVIRPIMARGGLILSERYLTDCVIVPERYFPLVPLWLKKISYVFVPKPDLIVSVMVDPSIIEERKKELPSELIQYEHSKFTNFTEKHDIPSIDNTYSFTEGMFQFETVIFEYLCTKK